MSPAKGLNDIEAQIAALEAKLGGIESDAEEDEASSRSGGSGSGRGGGIESAGGEKKAKKEKKAKETREEADVSPSSRRAGIAGPNDLAVACWLGEGEKGKSLSVLATKAEGGHLLQQLKERSAGV